MNFMKLQGNLINACPWELPQAVREKKIPPVISVNTGCCSHQAITLQLPRGWTLRELRIETGCPLSSSQPLQPPQWATPRVRTRKHRRMVPGSRGARQRDDFSKSLTFPFVEKHSIPWDVFFSLNNSDLVIFPLPGLCCENSILAPPLPIWSSSVELYERLHAGLKFSVLSVKESMILNL